LSIPTIGIGAGAGCDGQVLVTHDLLGLFERFTPKFVKKYANLNAEMKKAFADYIAEVGYDPKSKEKMDKLQAQAYQLKRQVEELDKNIATLSAIKKQRKELAEDKEAILQDYLVRREDLVVEVRGYAKEAETIQAYLSGLKTKGRISASGRIYPGVKLVIKDVKEDVKNEQRGLTFYLENQMIRTTRYEEPEDEILKRGPPDAHKAD